MGANVVTTLRARKSERTHGSRVDADDRRDAVDDVKRLAPRHPASDFRARYTSRP